MSWRERLGSYEIVTITLVMIGAILLLSAHTIRFFAFGYYKGYIEKISDLSLLSNLVQHVGLLIIGIGFFLSFRKINQKMELPRCFSYLNYTYLILLAPQIYYISVLVIEDWTINLSDLTNNWYFFGYFILPGIRKILLVIMFLSTFIVIVKNERMKRTQMTLEQTTEERLE
ncbi:MAG: hypothetical protein ACLFVB_09995 [Thermoplasmata archaeon]